MLTEDAKKLKGGSKQQKADQKQKKDREEADRLKDSELEELRAGKKDREEAGELAALELEELKAENAKLKAETTKK